MGALRTIAFVDGENIVLRYQAMLSEGKKPKNGVIHIQDIFAWSETTFDWSVFDLRRVYYYTSVVGDDLKLDGVARSIAKVRYAYSHEMDHDCPKAYGQLVPCIFKKAKQGQKTRMVDIQIIIDVMRAAHSTDFDVIYLFSGDGDYLPLIDEVMRRGKQVYVSAFTSGLNEKLISRVDLFDELDGEFFA